MPGKYSTHTLRQEMTTRTELERTMGRLKGEGSFCNFLKIFFKDDAKQGPLVK